MWCDLIFCLRKQWGKSVSSTWNSIDFPQNIIENWRKCEKSIQEWDVWIASLRFLSFSCKGLCLSIVIRCVDSPGLLSEIETWMLGCKKYKKSPNLTHSRKYCKILLIELGTWFFYHKIVNWFASSYYNLSSVCGRVCPETAPSFMGRQAPNLAARSRSGTKKIWWGPFPWKRLGCHANKEILSQLRY